jgi:hypothetical protein
MWKRTTSKKYWYALEVLPPAFQDAHGFLVGEPQDHAQCEVTSHTLPRYDAYVEKGTYFYASIRPLTIPEYQKFAPLLIAKKK